MIIGLPSRSLNALLLFLAVRLGGDGALSAPPADLATNCAALTQKAFTPRVAGNPAAGSFGGSSRSQQTFFSECIKNGGSVDEAAPNKGLGAQEPASTMPKR